jgi:flavorubredoxin
MDDVCNNQAYLQVLVDFLRKNVKHKTCMAAHHSLINQSNLQYIMINHPKQHANVIFLPKSAPKSQINCTFLTLCNQYAYLALVYAYFK